MKIRTGFVSNSSSSSFLIIYKDLKDFEKLDRFKGYVEFIKDLKTGTSAFEAIRGIEQLIFNFSYDALEDQLQFKPYKISADIYQLFTAAKEPLESLNDIMAKYMKSINAYYKKSLTGILSLKKSLKLLKGVIWLWFQKSSWNIFCFVREKSRILYGQQSFKMIWMLE